MATQTRVALVSNNIFYLLRYSRPVLFDIGGVLFGSHETIKVRTCIYTQVTGANQGIGLEIVRQLCHKFEGTVLLAGGRLQEVSIIGRLPYVMYSIEYCLM